MNERTQATLEKIKKIIKKEGIFTRDKNLIISPNGTLADWLIDLRKIFLDPEALDLITDIFWEIFENEYPFQVGGAEVASIPLVSAIVLKSQQRGKPVNGFIIRKSRKHRGLQNIVEGNLTNNKIILIDDLINSGQTLLYQVKILETLGKKANFFFTVINFRGQKTYEQINEMGIELKYLYTLNDFDLDSGNTKSPVRESFDLIWHFKSPNPNYFYAPPKSTPVLDEEKIYFGSDSGYFWALNQNNGSVAWKFKTGNDAFRKGIFSSPAIHNSLIYFGSYDGNLYALEKDTGKLKWKNSEADYVGSSPIVSPKLERLFIGLEYGLFKKHGGISALDLKTGKRCWHYEISEYVHCTPAYCPEKKLVAIGANDFCVYVLNAEDGQLKWKFKTSGPIKSSLIFDTINNLILFGSFDHNIYALDIDSGKLRGRFKTEDYIFSTPLVYDNDVFFTSTDKTLYCVNLKNGKLNWKFNSAGRLLSSPEIYNDKLYFGSNDGKMYEIDPQNGQWLSYFQTTERIVNKIVYNQRTDRFFILTFANEVYCIKKR